MVDGMAGTANEVVQTSADNGPGIPSHSTTISLSREAQASRPAARWHKVLQLLNWMPPWCRWNPESPPVFSVPMNILFAFAGTFTIANLYYNHPILNILAHDFNVPYETVLRVPTLMQAKYTTSLLFLCPLRDIFKRRQFVLIMVLFTATLWIGLCTTNSFAAFSAISFFAAIMTVIPQIMLPLVGDLAPPHKRAMALSIITSGNTLGVLLARILSGIVTQYTSWRNIYWLALGLQYLIFSLLWLFMPDYPSTNPGGLNYFKILWSILTLCRKHAVLMQAGLISYCTSVSFTNFWTILTFLLAAPPYHYDSLIIGLFALVGIAGMLLAPVYARLLINPFVPLFSVIVGEIVNITGIIIGTYTGTFTIAGPIIQAFGINAGLIITQIANQSAIYAVEPKGRNRVNTAFIFMTFLGQLTGTSAGNRLYARGGWRASGSLSVGFIAFSFLVCAARGPFETRWFGWDGGWSIRKKHKNSADGRGEEKRSELMPKEKTDLEHQALARIMSNTEKTLEGQAGEDGTDVLQDLNEKTKIDENTGASTGASGAKAAKTSESCFDDRE